ncbi:MAG: sigma-54-dependent Fis family transcriptional regulator [Deltaproteobacteria bacterium]|nr:MAG: sigma-54-dependent Fis family transcriptional regulator [Deltaproteobacteria bacterium]
MFEQDLSEYWETLVNTIHDGIMVVDRRGLIVYVNRAFKQITGYSEDEIIGKPCTTLGCDSCDVIREERGEHWCRLFNYGMVPSRRCTIHRKDGRTVYTLKNAALLQCADGNVVGAVETLTDITGIIDRDRQIAEFRRDLRSEDGFHGLLGTSPAMKQVYELMSNAAHTDAPVVILGESGTGKELVSDAIHKISDRRKMPFVKVNCAALNEALLESELFGHVKGAYTGAIQHREGRFEAANGGYIFLDEIGDLPFSTQVKLLRVIEEKVIERVGDSRPIPVDVRIISATNRNLEALVEQGLFREDLYFRINVIPIHLPPLREKKEDIALLADAFFHRLKLKSGKDIMGISNEALQALMVYDWPGNVRELKSAFEYAFVTCQESIIQAYHFPPKIFQIKGGRVSGKTAPETGYEDQKKRLLEALKKAGGNRSQAARLLGVSRVTVWKRMKKFNIALEVPGVP